MKNTILSICFLIFANIIFAQKDSTEIKTTNKTDKLISAAVILESDTLFTINSLKGNYPVKFRAKEISSRINNIAKSYNSLTDSIYLNPTVGFTEIKYNEKLLMVVTEQDAKLEKTSVKKLSNKRLKNIVNGLNNEVILTPIGWLKSIGFFVLSLLVLYGLIKLINLMFEKINLRLSRIERKFLSRKGNLLRYFLPGNSNNIFVFLVNVLRIIVIVFILFICIPISFSFFHFSGNLVQKFYGYIEEPIKYVFMGIINFIPSLFFIIIIGITARYFVRVINVITTDIENGKLEVKKLSQRLGKTNR
jgi:hypothetical protein